MDAREITTISELLMRLSEDAELLEQYLEDRDAVLAGSGLDDEKREILRSGNADRLVAALQEENRDSDVEVVLKPIKRPILRPIKTFLLPAEEEEST
jgi:hypothetical protein